MAELTFELVYENSDCEETELKFELIYKDSDCEGPDSKCVKLIASDGSEHIIEREHANQSGTLKAMLNVPGQRDETEANQVSFREIRGPVLEQVCKYLAYKAKYHESHVEIPEFPIDVDMCLELLMAANFLDC